MNKYGFTLAEILVTLGVLSVLMVVLVQIFFSSVRGGTKSQIVGIINENGRYILDMMDKDIRMSDEIICPNFFTNTDLAGSGNVLAVVKSGVYTRYRFHPPTDATNGYIERDNPIPEGAENDNVNIFVSKVCFPGKITTNNPVKITDMSTTNGVSVINGVFTRYKNAGTRGSIKIEFDLLPAVNASSKIPGKIDVVSFSTTVGLR